MNWKLDDLYWHVFTTLLSFRSDVSNVEKIEGGYCLLWTQPPADLVKTGKVSNTVFLLELFEHF
jgi:hypothetical protein